jgi:protein O-mannosyl-transferase
MSQSRFVAVALVVLTFATFWHVNRNGFVGYDDPDYITANPIIQQGISKKGLAWAFGRIHGENTYWHPITWLSHMIDAELFGLKPAGHHLMSLALHVANAALLFLVLYKLTGALWPSALVAGLFALHPLQVESFAWATERKNVLSTFFFMLTLWCYASYARSPTIARYLSSLLAFLLGLMCKPALVPLPGLLLLLDYWPLRRLDLFKELREPNAPQHSLTPSKKWIVLEKIPFLALAIASSLITLSAHRGLGMLDQSDAPPRGLRLANVVVSYMSYIRKALWPGDLAVFYPFPKTIAVDTLVVCALFFVAITGIVLWQLKKRPWLAVGWFWFVGMLVPTIGIVTVGIQAMADRFVYISVIGLFLVFVWAIGDWIQRAKLSRPMTVAIALLPFAALIPLAARQVGYWKNDYTLFERARTVTRDNYMAYTAVGGVLMREGKLDAAMNYFGLAKDIQPGFADTYYSIGVAMYRSGRLYESITNFEHALRIRPDYNEARLNLGLALQSAGRLDDSIQAYRSLLEKHPESEAAHLGIGNAFLTKGLSANAIYHFREAIRLNANSAGAMARLAWILATHSDSSVRNGSEAVRLAKEACELTKYEHVQTVNTLAAAYAETGQFDLAIQTAEQALDLAKSKRELNLVPIIENLRDRYRRREPYREGSA